MDRAFGPVWVIAEQSEGRILAVSFQLLGQARKLADAMGSSVDAVLLGDAISDLRLNMISAGADRIFVGESPTLKFYQPEIYCLTIVELAREHKPEIILIGSTSIGRELAPMVAARLGTGLTAHCIDLVLTEEMIMEQQVPAYGGLLSIVCPEKRPQMATVAKGVFPLPEIDVNREGVVIPVEIVDQNADRIQTVSIDREEAVGVSLDTAPIVVAGGAGAGDLDGWGMIAELAATLNAALGSTRPAVDEGWTQIETMIGQSGRMVHPELYIGVGISGELQHMVGIIGANIMVAINNDPKSPVFEQVDYGIVEDFREFVPVLIKKIKEYRE